MKGSRAGGTLEDATSREFGSGHARKVHRARSGGRRPGLTRTGTAAPNGNRREPTVSELSEVAAFQRNITSAFDAGLMLGALIVEGPNVPPPLPGKPCQGVPGNHPRVVCSFSRTDGP